MLSWDGAIHCDVGSWCGWFMAESVFFDLLFPHSRVLSNYWSLTSEWLKRCRSVLPDFGLIDLTFGGPLSSSSSSRLVVMLHRAQSDVVTLSIRRIVSNYWSLDIFKLGSVCDYSKCNKYRESEPSLITVEKSVFFNFCVTRLCRRTQHFWTHKQRQACTHR